MEATSVSGQAVIVLFNYGQTSIVHVMFTVEQRPLFNEQKDLLCH